MQKGSKEETVYKKDFYNDKLPVKASSTDAWKISGSLMIWTRKGVIRLQEEQKFSPEFCGVEQQ